ncbi:MAG TPA: hypothetical protein VJC39_04575 [Candidatus Nanoarchaeia archaeon]|nr:hypothetical protein [Candidatus Nanoarchaeia archaeon]
MVHTKPICPECKSKNVEIVADDGLDFLKCSDCGLNELEGDEVLPGQKTSQREKGRYSPYKTGGQGRSKN